MLLRSPQTPGGYQVNVNRRKTRKWVEAKVQNYDGDDWGADEFEDDEPPPPPVPRVTTGLRPVGQRLASESHGPSSRLAAAVASSSRSTSGPPSLQLQTQHPLTPSVPASVPEAISNAASPVLGRTASPAPAPARVASPDASGYHQPDVRSATPQSTASSAHARGSPAIRPADTFHRLEDGRRLGGSPQSIAEAIAAKPVQRPTPPNELVRVDSPRNDGSTKNAIQKQPTFDSILGGHNNPGPVQAAHDAPQSPDIHMPAQERISESSDDRGETIHHPEEIDRKRMSVSPQLPDVNRMSVFGTNLFSTPAKEESRASDNPQGTTKQFQPTSVAGGSSLDQSHAAGTPPPVEGEQDALGNRGSSSPVVPASGDHVDTQASLAADTHFVLPLRTPSPNKRATLTFVENPETVLGASSSTAPESKQTEPLQSRSVDDSPSESEPRSFGKQDTTSTLDVSPIKESDKLSEEIMRSLSPRASNTVLPPRGDNSQTLSPDAQTNLRNSSYTLQDYDSYWADANDGSGQDASKEAAGVKELPPVPIPEHEQKQLPPQQVFSITSDTALPEKQRESTDEHSSRKRFSWEAENNSNVNLVKSQPAVENLPRVDIPTINSPSPMAPSDIQSTRDAVSDVTSPGREQTQTTDTPQITVPPSGGISHQVSKASTLPPTQQSAAVLEPPSPISVETNGSNLQALENRRVSPEMDGMLPETAALEMSTTSVGPLGQLPTTMEFRDIMNLPTSDQRIAKAEEVRSSFATWESGLESWVSSLKSEHPSEYANATSSFATQSSVNPGHAATPSSSQPSSQQPYFQQYLNASSPTTAAPAASRTRLGGFQAPSGSSTFGNSSNQLGTKGKEFMHSAGKMGKGLLSKGKSKLRGTGDKVFH